MRRFENVKPELVGHQRAYEFQVEVNDSNGGLGSSILIAAGKSRRTAINKAIRTLKRLTKELEREVNDDA